jgi:biofilm protein TabA
MILDSIQNRAFYQHLGSGIAQALEYLATTDFSKLANGKYELDGQRMFAVVQRYCPKAMADLVWESHRKYIDVQYIAQGGEQIGYALPNDVPPLMPPYDPSNMHMIRQPYDPDRDVTLYEPVGDFFTIWEGHFAVFAPNEVHAPGLVLHCPNSVREILKVVVKCLAEQE